MLCTERSVSSASYDQNFQMSALDPSIPTKTCRSVTTLLSRSVRIALGEGTSSPRMAWNTFAGYPSVTCVPLWADFVVEVAGTPSETIGYITSLAQIDAATRVAAEEVLGLEAIPVLTGALTPTDALKRLSRAITQRLGHDVARLTWRVSPYHSYSWDHSMPERITVACQFEFAAAHRLNDPSLSDQENLALFGKCNRLNGHGHNYRLEVAVRSATKALFGMASFEALVADAVVDRFDHKNLNVDCPEFATLNPTVENIAAVCFDLLQPRLAAKQVDLVRVTVWETSKTSATVEVAPVAN